MKLYYQYKLWLTPEDVEHLQHLEALRSKSRPLKTKFRRIGHRKSIKVTGVPVNELSDTLSSMSRQRITPEPPGSEDAEDLSGGIIQVRWKD